MDTDGTVPTFGLWYDFRQRPPLGEYASFNAQWGTHRGGQALESMRLFASEVAPIFRGAVKA